MRRSRENGLRAIACFPPPPAAARSLRPPGPDGKVRAIAMWVVIRLSFAACVFLMRLVWRRQGVERTAVFGRYRSVLFIKRKKVGRGRARHAVMTKLYWGLEVKTPLVFSVHRETRWDRAMKWLGLAREMQTGDGAFDRAVYVAGDHPALHRLLTENAGLRDACRQLLAKTARRIFSDGRRLWVESADLSHASREELLVLSGIATIIQREGQQGRWVFDRFLWTAIGLEALVWSLALYGAPGLIELAYDIYVKGESRTYFDYWGVARPGLIAAIVAFAGLAVLMILLLRGSSRGHRVLAECFLVMLLGLPFAGIQAVIDFNASHQPVAPQLHEYRVAAKEEQRQKRRRSGSRWLHLLHLEPVTAGAPRFAGPYLVNRTEYGRTRVGEPRRFLVRTGRLGIPWIDYSTRRGN